MRILYAYFVTILCMRAVNGLRLIGSTAIGQDPPTVNRLNGESFQQDALVTFNNYQYAVFWTASTTNASIRQANVARRSLNPSGKWQSFVLTDYNQTEDDGHDVISLGISRGDGTLHIGFDQHDNPLNYRVSQKNVATHPQSVKWSSSIFGPTLDHLPGLESLDKSVYFINITYPRFLNIPTNAHGQGADLLLELRVGRSGLGDDWLYRYVPNDGWKQIGRYLEGVNNNAYINGLDFDSHGALLTTWTYRDYVNDTGQNVAVQAGPNGPENNHDLNFAYSHDVGYTWFNNWNQQIANTSSQVPIVPVSAGITVFGIPKYGGILNQEAQTIDSAGRLHVLNRENTTGVEQWYHYWRDTNTYWTRTALPSPANLVSVNNITGTPTVIGKRGKLVSSKNALYAILPSNAANSTALSIIGSTVSGHFVDWEVLWESSNGNTAEPLFDRHRLTEDDVLSLFLVNGTNLQVVDFTL
ncbi:hypothetical protein BDY19DRAFT_452721 [Irpex rosettiformis]|uniref:Uncharacterized protein n=1 Tax=Irpex rosettiformis TaxID=378272 RepID=A0ACB8TT70_9APHY|nr:hypothetical protein BDY19DRAFT_452721 [Irpex rosettiformis]